MNRTHPAVSITLTSLVLALFNGCSSFQRRDASATADNAYIYYWPERDNHKGPRLAVKDLIDVKGVVTTAGSEFLAKKSEPAERDAKLLQNVRARNIPIVGKTNTTELAVGVSGINTYFGTPLNPLGHQKLIPGGSSSGSAVAVANGTADIAIGTDTAGSIRVPAACCGVVGLKTTFGLIPLDGVYPISPTHLDTVGPLARNVEGVVQGMDLLQTGFSQKYRSAVAANPRAERITVGRLYLDGTDPKVDRALDEALKRAGFKVVRMSDRFKKAWEQAEKDASTVAAASAWLYDQRYRSQPEVTTRTKLVVAVGEYQYNSNLKDALARQPLWKATLRRTLQQVDFVALPTLQRLPPKVPLFGGTPAFEAAVLGLQNTEAVNLAGNPALAIPVPVEDRHIPVTSLQLIGKSRGEAELLNAGRLIENTNPSPHVAQN